MNLEMKTQIENKIQESLSKLISTNRFKDFFKEANPADEDYVVFNNSFMLRRSLSIRPTKNSQYLALLVENGSPNTSNICVCTPSSFDPEFKIINKYESAAINFKLLKDCLEMELENLGELVFFLIGEIIDKPQSTSVKNKDVKELILDTSAKEASIVDDGRVLVLVTNQLIDQSKAWNSILNKKKNYPNINWDALEQSFSVSFKNLRNEARLIMEIPQIGAVKNDNSLLNHLAISVNKQVNDYDQAINELNLVEIKRIAYNFESDAFKFLKVLVTLCDLKGIVLWLTINEHFMISEAFKNLPWTSRENKPSVKDYQEKIGGARNHAFHDFFFIDRTIDVNLTNVKVPANKLILFPEFKDRQKAAFQYKDKDLVDVINELSRSSEVMVDFEFWRRNLEVIKSFESLLVSTNEALWLLCNAR